MRPLTASELVSIWECGAARHPIDRALLLVAAVRPDLAVDALPDLPLGERNATLLRLRRSTFGAEIRAYVDCPDCGERLQVALDTAMFDAAPGTRDTSAGYEVDGFRFRPPTSRDLATVVSCANEEAAAQRLLERCCVAQPPDRTLPSRSTLDTIGARLESLDPYAAIELALTCHACAHAWTAPFDIAALLWDEVEARARGLLAAVHVLASAYGWREDDILALGEHRRAAYLAMVTP